MRGVDDELPDLEQVQIPIRVVLADDSVLLREGIASLLTDKGFEIVGQSGTADDLLLKVRSYNPDIAIVDIKMPPTHTDEGLRAAKEIREKFPDTAVLVLSQYVEEGYALELLQTSTEGVGYLLKDRVYDLTDFVAAVKRVAEGGSALDPSVVSQLVGRRRRDDPIGDLSAREREVLGLMAEGLSNSAIAARVFLTERGVEKHVTSIFQKLRLPWRRTRTVAFWPSWPSCSPSRPRSQTVWAATPKPRASLISDRPHECEREVIPETLPEGAGNDRTQPHTHLRPEANQGHASRRQLRRRQQRRRPPPAATNIDPARPRHVRRHEAVLFSSASCSWPS